MRALVLCLLLAGCRHTGAYVWAEEYPAAAAAPAEYAIVPGDGLFVRVLNHDEMSGHVRVRSDGRISVPFLRDLPAAGLAPGALAEKIQDGLKDYLAHALVTVT